MRIVLARVLWNFDLELCPKSDECDQKMIYTFWDVSLFVCETETAENGEQMRVIMVGNEMFNDPV